jgi:lipopolysaccharide export LptBFGC system permease protein LptF
MALVDLLNEHDVVQRRIELIMLLHRRLTTPVLDFLLVVVACLLLRVGQTGHSIYLKFGACLFLYAALQGIQFTCQGLSQHEIIDPMLAAWLPVLVLGPVTFACLPELRH